LLKSKGEFFKDPRLPFFILKLENECDVLLLMESLSVEVLIYTNDLAFGASFEGLSIAREESLGVLLTSNSA
jgi:hypothetical protein